MPVRVGLVDFDSSHCVEFTKRLNHRLISEDQWVDGAVVVAGWTGSSAITPQETVNHYRRMLTEELGVTLVDRLEDLIPLVDGVMVLSVDGSVHRERASLFLERGLPVYIDKPFVTRLEDGLRLADCAERTGAPLFTSSSLRYALEVQQVHERKEEWGPVVSAHAFSPAPTHPRNPGLFHYGIHAVETLFALMGKGCRRVRNVHRDDAEMIIGEWQDGRIGSVLGIRKGAHQYGFTVVCEKHLLTTLIDTRSIYRELLKRVVLFFEQRKSPVDIKESLEIVAFIDGAAQSAEESGLPVDLPQF
ncbi:MAG: Gfo/Idh/MocA family oxidoreductase [Armatimonadota bacterium]|nr:Gfo/Idh/MocA family oxidoreductase [Armatimonadota bacterium]